jgi:hypothetical protein
MPKEKRKKSEFEDYTEKLIPIRVTITRQRGNLTYVFDIAGFRGVESGQIYYKGKDVLEVERFMERNNVIHAQVIEGLGWVLSFETPQTLTSPSFSSTDTVIARPEIFGIQPGTKTTYQPAAIRN